MTLRLDQIWDLACRFIPTTAADRRLSESGPLSWWPAHEIGHFLVATADECRQPMFGLDATARYESPLFRYVVAREIAAISISQRLLRRSGHVSLADEEIQYTDEGALECAFERWCKRAVNKLLQTNRIMRLPTTFDGMEALLARKASEVGTKFYPSARRARRARSSAFCSAHALASPSESTIP